MEDLDFAGAGWAGVRVGAIVVEGAAGFLPDGFVACQVFEAEDIMMDGRE